MKKEKKKSSKTSARKQIRKEIEVQLFAEFLSIANQFGKVKKADKLIEKFAKQMAKKITIEPKDDSLEGFVKEDEVSIVAPEVKPIIKKATAKKKITAPAEAE
ncbi:hypothetical protein ACJVDH_14035 [Pedobacter sp. AW1-32]|uniref:hypothetical protein n=1 Tax=Pedobacter sp. AW1-32 TaxID=3383026 RepID=UPI003FED5BF4